MPAPVTDSGTIQYSYSSEFMKNYAPELPIESPKPPPAAEAIRTEPTRCAEAAGFGISNRMAPVASPTKPAKPSAVSMAP